MVGQNFALLFIRKYILNETVAGFPDPLCQRFRIGSSLVQKLIHQKVTIHDTHGDYFSGKSRIFGNAAEAYVQQLYGSEIVISKPFLISEDFPFICGTPDFVIEDGSEEIQLLEVKSSTTEANVFQYCRAERTVMQLLTCLQIFNIASGRIVGVLRDDHAGDFEVIVEDTRYRTNRLFKHRSSLIKGYVKYLDSYFSWIYNLNLLPETKESLINLLKERIPLRRKLRPSDSLNEVRMRLKKTSQKQVYKCLKHPGARVPHLL